MSEVRQVPRKDRYSWATGEVALQDVADWCGGMVVGERFRRHILVDGMSAFPGDWIREDGNGFEVIASRAEADL